MSTSLIKLTRVSLLTAGILLATSCAGGRNLSSSSRYTENSLKAEPLVPKTGLNKNIKENKPMMNKESFSRIHDIVKDKIARERRGWTQVNVNLSGEEFVANFKKETQSAFVVVMLKDSETAAKIKFSEIMRSYHNRVKVDGIGDEAYQLRFQVAPACAFNVREKNVVIHVSASSEEVAREFCFTMIAVLHGE